MTRDEARNFIREEVAAAQKELLPGLLSEVKKAIKSVVGKDAEADAEAESFRARLRAEMDEYEKEKRSAQRPRSYMNFGRLLGGGE